MILVFSICFCLLNSFFSVELLMFYVSFFMYILFFESMKLSSLLLLLLFFGVFGADLFLGGGGL